jgi:hypothetical protein
VTDAGSRVASDWHWFVCRRQRRNEKQTPSRARWALMGTPVWRCCWRSSTAHATRCSSLTTQCGVMTIDAAGATPGGEWGVFLQIRCACRGFVTSAGLLRRRPGEACIELPCKTGPLQPSAAGARKPLTSRRSSC